MARPVLFSVYAIIRGIDPGMATLAHEGSKRYREVFDLVHRREAAKPNQIWQADHTLLDLWVLTPSGRPGRPWLALIEDDHSRAVAGYTVNLGAPSALTAAAEPSHDPDDERFARCLDHFLSDDREVVDVQDALDLGDETASQAEVPAGDAGDRGDPVTPEGMAVSKTARTGTQWGSSARFHENASVPPGASSDPHPGTSVIGQVRNWTTFPASTTSKETSHSCATCP